MSLYIFKCLYIFEFVFMGSRVLDDVNPENASDATYVNL